MLKYLKELFREVIMKSQQLVRRNAQPVINEEMENSRSTLDIVEPRELSRPPRERKIFCNNENCMESCVTAKNSLRCYAKRISEIEERKKRETVMENENKTCEEKTYVSEETCRCENCSVISTLNECGVCLESLQTRGIKTCPVCANIVCSKCAEKLRHCPFCRSSLPMQKNRAIERLLGGLFLPCGNFRRGCRKMLNSEMRSRHEASCDHTSISCPVSSDCHFNGTPASIMSHLKKAHDLKPLDDHGLTVEISSFRQRTITKEGEYTIYLSCYSQLFAVKVMLRRKKLILSFSQLGYVTRIAETMAGKKYGVWIKIKVDGQKIRGAFPFGRNDRETRQIEIDYETLMCCKRNDTSSHGDDVKIDIAIREMKRAFSK